MTTNVGSNQSNTIAQNQTTSVGLNQTETVGAVKNVSVGGNFFTNVIGRMIEFITGNKESHTEKDRIRISEGTISTQSKGDHQQHSENSVQNNSGTISNTH